MITVYGIKNCDTCRKALKFLADRDIEHRFHDFRKDGLGAAEIDKWLASAGWETVLNRRGTTWWQLPEATRDNVSEKSVAGLMVENPTLIKRPVIDNGGTITVGFSPDIQKSLEG